MGLSPFICGRTVNPQKFLNRKKILNTLMNRITTSQSSAIVGHPHTGKSSLLVYLRDNEDLKVQFPELEEESAPRLIFSYLNCQVFNSEFDFCSFWKQALGKVKEFSPLITTAYKNLETNRFSVFKLDQFSQTLNDEGVKLVLLLDEIDTLINHPLLNNQAFYGCLRHLTSQVDGGICIITASRCSLELLNRKTQEINPHGSPYFNTLIEYRLGALSEKAADELLGWAGDSFSSNEKEFIKFISGCHPFLMQLSAAILWDQDDDETKLENAVDEIRRQTEAHFRETWRSFSNSERKITTAIALNQIPKMINGRRFKSQKLIKNMSDYDAELRLLHKTGILTKNKGEDKDHWIIVQNAFLWWLGDEIKRHTRGDMDFNDWITAQEFDGLLTRDDKDRWKKAAGQAGNVIKNGIGEFIKQGLKSIKIFP